MLTELRSEDGERIVPYAMYARVRPWTRYNFDIQAGRIPPVFGTFARRSYSADNPLIGYPLAYQYLTSLRPNAIPATADDLLQMRARGWLANYPVGVTTAAPGVPLVSAYRWDTGVEAHAATEHFDAAVARHHGDALQSAARRRQRRAANLGSRRLDPGRRARPRALGIARRVSRSIPLGPLRDRCGPRPAFRRMRRASTRSTRAGTGSCGARRS